MDSCDVIHVGAFGSESTSLAADKRIITTTRSHMTHAVKKAIDACKPTEIVRVGGAGHKVGFLLWLIAVVCFYSAKLRVARDCHGMLSVCQSVRL